MDSDDAFNQFIEIDAEAIGKENRSVRLQPNTKKEQFDKIAAFLEEYKEQLKNKDSVDQLWDKLALEVNKIGPPHYIGSAWRKKWSDHKSNKNRKRPMSDQTANIESSQCEPLNSSSIKSTIPISESWEAKQDLILQELKNANQLQNVIIQELKESNQKQNVITQLLEKSNSLLEEIARKD